MISDHVYRSNYAGIDPERQRCVCGQLRAEHSRFIAPRIELGEQPGMTSPWTIVTEQEGHLASTEVPAKLSVPQAPSDPTAQHSDRDGSLASSGGSWIANDTESDSRPESMATEVRLKLPLAHQQTAVDPVNHPPHYAASEGIPFQCIEIVRDMGFDCGNAVKYLWRTELKNGRQDVDKARWYLEDAIKWDGPMYVGPTPMQWKSRLSVVIRAQTDPLRKDFFTSIRSEEAEWALVAVRAMLARDE